jgi:hypothetical protein
MEGANEKILDYMNRTGYIKTISRLCIDAPYGTDNINLAISQMHEAGMSNDEIELHINEYAKITGYSLIWS